MQCERNVPLERGSFCLFYEKTYRAKDTFLFKKKSNKSGQKNWRWCSLTIFTKEATPEQGQNVWDASAVVVRLDRTSHTRGRAEDDHRIEFSVRSIEATAAVDRARRVQLIALVVCGRCPAKLSFLPAVTGHTWHEHAPKVLKKMRVVDMPGSLRLGHLVLILGRRGDHHMIFHIFSMPFLPWVFHRRLFKVLHKKMKSTVWHWVLHQCATAITSLDGLQLLFACSTALVLCQLSR